MENVTWSPKKPLEGSVGPSREQMHPVTFKLLLKPQIHFSIIRLCELFGT